MRNQRNRSVVAFLVLAGAAWPSRAQDVAYEKYTLPNGMTVILHEDRSLPTATINIWYRVGAQDEPPGRSGFAHLFEHLMFMGTERVPGNEFDVLMETGGGANNASTDLHRTNYFSWGPSTLLPTLLWLDADRLEDMGLNMTQDKLDKQRDVVRNELRQNVENAPYGKADEAIWRLAFPEGHPYVTGVIGTHEDLEAASVTNVKDFFASFYVPNNASIVVAGDFDAKAIRPMVDKLFGTLPPGQPIARKYAIPAEPIPLRVAGVKRFTGIDQVQQPRVQVTWLSARGFAPGDAELTLASAVLAEGKSSRLYKRLVIDEKLCVDVNAAQQGYTLAGLFQVNAFAKPEASLSRVEALIDEEVARLIKDGPTGDELERSRSRIELAMLQGLQSIERKADRMNEYEYYWGEPNSFKRDLDRYRQATPASVKDWAAQALRADARVITWVLPEEPTREAGPRDKRPGDAAAGAFQAPAPESFTLANGLAVDVWRRPALPMVSMALVSGPSWGLRVPARPGLARLTAQMLGEGAGDRDALAFEDAVQAIGATFASTADQETVTATMTVLKRNLAAGGALFADAVLRPRFDEAEWARVRALHVEELRQASHEPGPTSARVAARLLFDERNPYSIPATGTIASVEAMTRDDLRSAHIGMYEPGRCRLLIAGDVTPGEARSLAESMFASWRANDRQPTRPALDCALRAGGGPRVAIVDRPGSTQTFIRFAAPGVKLDHPDRVALDLLNTILGGSFTSRLNQNLREEKGYTYGARSSFVMGPSCGHFFAAASVQGDKTGPALVEFFKEFGRLSRGDVAEDEAGKARETYRTDAVRGFQTLQGHVGVAAAVLQAGLPFETIASDLATAGGVSASRLNALAASAIRVSDGVLVLVGDKGVILEHLKGLPGELGLGTPSFYDPEGNPIDERGERKAPATQGS